MKNNFLNDLKDAKQYEYLAAEAYRSKGWNVELAPDRYFPDYDILLKKDELEARIEVKVDNRTYETNNICVEYVKADGVTPSGITVGNMSDHILFFLPDPTTGKLRYFITTKKKLYNICIQYHTRINMCGDQNGYYFLLNIKHIDGLIKDFPTPKIKA